MSQFWQQLLIEYLAGIAIAMTLGVLGVPAYFIRKKIKKKRKQELPQPSRPPHPPHEEKPLH